MPKWLLPWLFPVGLIVVVVAVGASTLIGAVPAALITAALALVIGFVGLPLIYRTYQANRPESTGDARDRRADPPNNRSLLR